MVVVALAFGLGLVLTLARGIAAGAPGAAPATGPAEPTREEKLRRVGELKVYFEGRDRELARLVSAHREKTKEAETLFRQVDALKAKPNRSYLEQRDLEKLLAKGRVQLEAIDRLTSKENETRDEAFAAAAALVAEYESFMEEDLRTLAAESPVTVAERKALTDRVLGYERERRSYQARMNALTTPNPMPAEIPSGAKWTREMIEDQRRAWEAVVARLQAERNQLIQEQGLRHALAEALPGATVTADSAGADARLAARIAELDRQIGAYRGKLGRLSGAAAAGN